MTFSLFIRRAGWVVVGLIVLLWRAGYGTFPDSEFLATEIVPSLPSLPQVPPLAQFTLSSPIGAVVASLFRATTETSFNLVQLGVLIAFVVAIGVLLCRRYDYRTAAFLGAGFVGSQTSVILLAWIGSYDVFTVGLSSLIVLARHRWLALTAGFLLTFAAFEQGLIVLAMLGILAVIGMFAHWRMLLWAAGGLLVARLVQQIWLSANHVMHGRMYFFQQTGLDAFLEQFWKSLPWLLPTGLGVTIVAVVLAVASEPSWRNRIIVISLFVACLIPVAMTFDQSRVFAVLTWPLVMVLLLRYAERTAPKDIERVSMLTLGLAALLPGIFVWTGKAQLAKHHLLRVLKNW